MNKFFVWPKKYLIIWVTSFLITIIMLTGCVLNPVKIDLPRFTGSPDGLSRDDLLSVIAACHLLRVGQTNDVAVTDATVIAAANKYGYQINTIVARAARLIREDNSRGQALIVRARGACEQLANATKVTSALMRFESDGRLRTTWLRIDGIAITRGFAEHIIADLRKQRAIGLIINSPGGSVEEARKLGHFLRANGLRVGVDRICTSACVDVLAGGVERLVTENVTLGIHQSRVPDHAGSHESGQLYVADSFRYLREMGVDADVAIAAASIPNNELLLISLSDALTTRLITGVIEKF